MSRLRGYHIGADGHLMEWYYDWADEDPQHRHQSHLFDAHSPFQIDGNFGGCAGVMEMLLRSEEHLVDPLPALPSAWPDGYIRGIRTRTGQTVDLVWKHGKVKKLKIK